MIETIANKYAQPSYQDVVVAIELLNEPLGSALASESQLVQFYKDGFGKVRSVSDTPVILEDAFEKATFWNDVLSTGGNNGLSFLVGRLLGAANPR